MAVGTRLLMGMAGLAFVLTASVATAGPQCGIASWYSSNRHSHGATDGNSAAHRTLPFGTKVRVRNTRNNREVVVHINDRGPFIRGRVIDVSRKASKALGIDGIGSVCLTVVKDGDVQTTASIPPSTRPAKTVAPRPSKTAAVRPAAATPPTLTPPATVAPPPPAIPAAPEEVPYPRAQVTHQPEVQTTIAAKAPPPSGMRPAASGATLADRGKQAPSVITPPPPTGPAEARSEATK